MSLKHKIFITIACLLFILITIGLGVTLGYFSDSESATSNILRFKSTF